jgi:metal-responsive CopG/Arc/MetJ family transcriptional regulator
MKNLLIKISVRLPEALLNQLDDWQKARNYANRSEACRYVIESYLKQTDQRVDLQELKDRHEFVIRELENLNQKDELNQELYRYVASLLTSLVRKSSRSDPGEAEKMISKAKAEAKHHTEKTIVI